ncbi:ribonuclease D [Quadrisphaera granulorum]|uniref:Ribonuclease D n=1 Tax=Quadrisphaera granulorum TaxID=317664 RepID=A0A316A9D2_9ACTN|nr:HRDC domain-containing protein [Quadrisphaera granulorum]PWJ53474.1 ribonuclease D [Quadrisphaera granulorum]SZE96816.1 ribonuclease D [Quadrisphaera granulorum]
MSRSPSSTPSGQGSPPGRDTAPETSQVPGAVGAPAAESTAESIPGSAAPDEQAAAPELPLLAAPADGLPALTDSPEALAAVVEALAAGTGPVAVDAERASGYRYGQDAQLVQLRREGAGTILIDPRALPDLSSVSEALGDTEWVLHAANQDLPCLTAVGLRPGGELFDTELGGRLAGYERVGLGAVVERLLGVRLAKEHSAVDWSTRPLPEPWLLYAALDVELLVDLRDALAADLAAQGKLEWARQEFAAVRDAPPTPARVDPWRRTSGLHAVRQRRQLAAVRELWLSRDELARKRDTAPGRILPDRAVVAAAQAMPTSARELAALPVFSGPANRRLGTRWLEALDRARALPEGQLPPHSLPTEGPPPPRAWKDRDPEAAERLTRARTALTELSEEVRVPLENLLSPDAVRRLCWQPPADTSEAGVSAWLADTGARPWQRELTAGVLSRALHG